MKIGQIIRNIRKEKNSTLEELAFHVGTDAANLSRIERGKQNPTPEVLEKVSYTLNVPLSSMYLMVEQSNSAYEVISKTNRNNQIPKNLDYFITQFMLLNTENQDLIHQFMSTMLKKQEEKLSTDKIMTEHST